MDPFDNPSATEFNMNGITTSVLFKVTAHYLMEAVRTHNVSNILFKRTPDDWITTELTDEVEVYPACEEVCILNLSSIDVRAIEHIFPSSYEALDISFFIHEISDKFPSITDEIEEAYSLISSHMWDWEKEEEINEDHDADEDYFSNND